MNIARNIQIEAKKKAKEVAASERGTPNSTSRQSKYSTVNSIIVIIPTGERTGFAQA